jgi:hypothetical protein
MITIVAYFIIRIHQSKYGSLVIGLSVEGGLGDRFQPSTTTDLQPSQSTLQRCEIHLLLLTGLVILNLLSSFGLSAKKEGLLIQLTSQELGKHLRLNKLIQVVDIVTNHCDFLLRIFGYFMRYFCPYRIEQHRRIDKHHSKDINNPYLFSMRGKYLTILPMATCIASSIFLDASCINLPLRSIIHTTCYPSSKTYSAKWMSLWLM